MDRFTLEAQIMKCWNIIEHVRLTNEALLDRGASTDEVSNMLLGIESIYSLEFEKLQECFEELIHKGVIS